MDNLGVEVIGSEALEACSGLQVGRCWIGGEVVDGV